MRTLYDVSWMESGDRHSGRLALQPHSLVLTSHEGGGYLRRELPFDRVVTVTLLAETEGVRRLMLSTCDGATIEIESRLDARILRDLVERLLANALATTDIPMRFLVSSEPGAGWGRGLRPGLGLS